MCAHSWQQLVADLCLASPSYAASIMCVSSWLNFRTALPRWGLDALWGRAGMVGSSRAGLALGTDLTGLGLHLNSPDLERCTFSKGLDAAWVIPFCRGEYAPLPARLASILFGPKPSSAC